MDESELLAEAIARTWPNSAIAGSAESNGTMLNLLRALESRSNDGESVRRDILALVDRYPESRLLVERHLAALRAADAKTPAGTAIDVARPARHYRHTIVDVVFATDREPVEKRDRRIRFGKNRGDLTFGTVRVNIPDDHRMAGLERPRNWPLDFRQDLRRQLRGSDTMPGLTSDLGCLLVPQLRRAPSPELLVFVHGYNVSFDDAARRAAQIAYDIDFPGVPVLYSWPSAGSPSGYLADGERAAASMPGFLAFLRGALLVDGCRRVHVLAHSMGNRIVTEALALLDDERTPEHARLGQVVFWAPDVDVDVFADRARRFATKAERFTLYTSGKDRALGLSRHAHGFARAGQAGRAILVAAGVDTIDVTDLDTDFMSHSYVGDNRSVLSDLYLLIRHGHSPDDRPGLLPVASPAGVCWAFRR